LLPGETKKNKDETPTKIEYIIKSRPKAYDVDKETVEELTHV